MTRKSNKQELFEYFITNPRAQLRLRELERETKLPLPSLSRYLKELDKEGIVVKQKIGSTTFYTANRGSEEYRIAKRLETIRRLYTSGAVALLREHYHNAPLRLYGSASRGEDDEQSDIDIFIETPLTTEPNVDAIERVLGQKIHLLRSTSIQTMEQKELANNILNGTQLHGRIEAYS